MVHSIGVVETRPHWVRRKIDGLVREVRSEMAEVCNKMADERGEPPLSAQC
jgi:hypothetical protein